MPEKTAATPIDLKAQIDQIASDEAAPEAGVPDTAAAPEPAPVPQAAAARPQTPAASAPAPKAAPAPAPPAESAATPATPDNGRPGGGTSPAAALTQPSGRRRRSSRKRERGPHITIRIDDDMHTRIKQMATDCDRSMENLLRRIINRSLTAHEARQETRRGRGHRRIRDARTGRMNR